MINKEVLCAIQQKKIFVYIVIIISSITFVTIINITITNKNHLIKKIISQKKDDIERKKKEINLIDKTIDLIKKESANIKIDTLKEKNCFYQSFDKQRFLNALMLKMNSGLEINEFNGNLKKINLEYSNFSIKSKQANNDKINKTISALKARFITSKEQDINFSVTTDTLTINFLADYEYVAYHMLEMLKQVLPGNVIVKSFSVQPVRVELKKMLYARRFENQNENNFRLDLDNRLNCTIELEWLYLSYGKEVTYNKK